MPYSGIETGIGNLRKGEFIIITDNRDRENEGDLVIAAEKATPQKINFMIKEAGGLICAPMEGDRLDMLKIPLMVPQKLNNETTKCRFTVSVDFRIGTSTGISASDRSATIRALASEKSSWKDFAMPGHVFPLRYEEGGVLKREGHTEAAVDMCRLAGLYPAAAICEILDKNGNASKTKDLMEFSRKHGITIIPINSLLEYMRANRFN